MTDRDELAKAVTDKREKRMDSARQEIMSTYKILDARTEFQKAVRALPGVSDDPDTVPDIVLLMDTYVQRVLELSAQQDTVDTVNVPTDTCWRSGVHPAHLWTFNRAAHRCPGLSTPR